MTRAGRWRVALVALVALLTSVVPGAARAATLTPTGSTTPVHDPTIVRQGDTWYVFSTGSRLPVRRSTDLVHWSDVGVVFPQGLPTWLTDAIPGPGDDAWAPDVSYFGGVWHLYYAKAVFGTQDATIGLATSATLDPADPAYGWVDQGMIVRSHPGDPVVAIDPNVVIDEHGDPWLTWGSFWDGIVIQRLDSSTGQLLTDAPRIGLARRDPTWLGVEGAQIFWRDGWWWLQASFGFCCRGVDSFYAVHLGRSRDLTGPYLDMAGVPLTENGGTLLVGSHDDQIGIGHGTIFDAGSPGWLLVHHYYDAAHNGTPTMGLTPLADLDGWPIGTDPGFAPATAPAASAPGTWHVVGYRENAPAHAPDDVQVGLQVDGTVAGGGTWTVTGNVLEIGGVPVIEPDGTPATRTWRVLVDSHGDLALGRDERTAGVRLTRVGPPLPTTTPTTTATTSTATTTAARPAVPAVSATPRFTG